MIKTCEDYAKSHNLCFSTDQDPNKCKTKCLAFLRKTRPLPPMYLCGNSLPWVRSAKHLGTTIENKIDGMRKDILVKRADFINKNNEILQEFYFSHPDTKIKTRLGLQSQTPLRSYPLTLDTGPLFLMPYSLSLIPYP